MGVRRGSSHRRLGEKRERKYPEDEQPAMPRKDRILSSGEGTESLLSRIIAYGYFVRNRIVWSYVCCNFRF